MRLHRNHSSHNRKTSVWVGFVDEAFVEGFVDEAFVEGRLHQCIVKSIVVSLWWILHRILPICLLHQRAELHESFATFVEGFFTAMLVMRWWALPWKLSCCIVEAFAATTSQAEEWILGVAIVEAVFTVTELCHQSVISRQSLD